MAEPAGTVYLRAGGAERFRKDTSKLFARRVNKTLLKLDDALPRYAAIPRDQRTLRTQALLALIALCDDWLSDKQTKIDNHESFRARAIQALHEASVSELRGLQHWARARGVLVAKQNWTKTVGAVRKIIPEGSLDGAGNAPVRVMQEENWLEILDKHHRRGQELKAHFKAWETSGQQCSFWEYLEKLDPAAKKSLEKVSVHYVDDLVYRDLFAVSFQNGLMRSRMSSVVQNMIVSKWSPETVLLQAEDKLLDTTTWPSSALRGLSTGWAAFVLSPQEVIYAGLHVNGLFHHSSFLCGAPVLASGMIRVEKGRVTGIHEKNGHYKSQEIHLITFLKLLQRNMPGTDWHDVEYFTFSGLPMTVGQKLNLPRKPPVPSRANRGPLSSAMPPPVQNQHGQVQRSGRPLPPLPGLGRGPRPRQTP